MRCRNYSMFHHFHPLRLEWCSNFDTNPCQSLALKDVNLCVKYVAGLWQEKWGTNASMASSGEFSRTKPLRVSIAQMRGGFIVRTSTWMAQGHLSPPRAFIYFSPQSIFHCPGLRSVDVSEEFRRCFENMGRNSHGKLANKGRSMFENINV